MKLKLRDFEPKLFTGAMSVDYDTILERASEALEHPADSAWSDDELWKTHTMLFATPDIELTDDYLADWSNYRTILKALKDAYPDDVEDSSFGHWTYSRFCAVKVRVVNKKGHVTPAFCEAMEIAHDLEHNNHLYDESDYMELLTEAEERVVETFATDNNLELSVLWEVMSEHDIYFSLYDGWQNLDHDDTLINLVREKSSTWDAHYNGGAGHHPEQCWYCERAKVVA
jgi:hypothetical protein